MKEGPESNADDKKLTRRAILKGVIAGAALAAGAGTVLKMRSDEKKWREQLEDRFHATGEYMQHGDGALAKNFARLEEIGKKLASLNYLEREKKRADYDEEIKQIIDEKNALLVEFDEVFIPQLLVQYVKADLVEKSLVKSYVELGGDLEEIKKKDIRGLDFEKARGISSRLEYHIDNSAEKFGEATYRPLEFYISN